MTRALILIFLILAAEAGVQLWRHYDLKASTDPVFFWKDAELVTRSDPTFGRALDVYRADRGMEAFRNLPAGARLQTFYIEWDGVEAGPFIDVSGHETDYCNVAAGFTLLEADVPRIFEIPGRPPFEFYYTRLADPSGKIVHAYKMPWIQGIGAWQINSAYNRSLRLQRSFLRHRGAARVIQFAVSGVASEEEAWAIVQRELQDRLEWRE